ncbi:transcriptional regulator, partial [Streptomyces tateyamensis]
VQWGNFSEIGGAAVMRAQLKRLLKAAERPNITVQVLPFSAGEHYALGASLTLHTLPKGNRVAYIEGARRGQIYEAADKVRNCALVYDDLRARALPPNMSLDMIKSVMEGIYRDPRYPSKN